MLISAYPTAGLEIDSTVITDGIEGSVLIVGPGQTISQTDSLEVAHVSILGLGSSMAPLLRFWGLSSSGTPRPQAYINSQFIVEDDATYTSRLMFGVEDFTGNREGLIFEVNGERVWAFFQCKVSIPARDGQIGTPVDDPTVIFDCENYDRQIVTLAGNRILSLVGDSVGQQITLILIQGAGGNKTVTWFPGIRWPGGIVPTLSTTVGKIDVITLLKLSDGEYLGFTPGIGL